MIKYGVRVPRGQNRVPREYLLRRIGQRLTVAPSAPTLLTSGGSKAAVSQSADPAQTLSKDINYTVAVTYSKDGNTKTFSGTFLGRNAQAAEQAARAFVLRYIRPSSVSDTVALPI